MGFSRFNAAGIAAPRKKCRIKQTTCQGVFNVIWSRTMDYKTFLAESAKRREEVRKLREELGWTWRQIGEHFKITPQRAQQLGNKPR